MSPRDLPHPMEHKPVLPAVAGTGSKGHGTARSPGDCPSIAGPASTREEPHEHEQQQQQLSGQHWVSEKEKEALAKAAAKLRQAEVKDGSKAAAPSGTPKAKGKAKSRPKNAVTPAGGAQGAQDGDANKPCFGSRFRWAWTQLALRLTKGLTAAMIAEGLRGANGQVVFAGYRTNERPVEQMNMILFFVVEFVVAVVAAAVGFVIARWISRDHVATTRIVHERRYVEPLAMPAATSEMTSVPAAGSGRWRLLEALTCDTIKEVLRIQGKTRTGLKAELIDRALTELSDDLCICMHYVMTRTRCRPVSTFLTDVGLAENWVVERLSGTRSQ